MSRATETTQTADGEPVKKPALTLWPDHWAGGWGQHSSLPNRIRIVAEMGEIVAYVEHHGPGEGQSRVPTDKDYRRAREIVAAYNCHDELLAACKGMLEYMPCSASQPCDTGLGISAMARAAIAKAEGRGA